MKTNIFKTIDVSLDTARYSVHIGRGLLKNLVSILDPLTKNKKIMVVADANFQELIETGMIQGLRQAGYQVFVQYLVGGKHNKNINEVLKIYGIMEVNDFARDSTLIALGGGVIGDLAGFVASTYLRGINLVHIPTTLMAMVDSSLGGKVAINFRKTINAIGNYYHPIATLMDFDFLTSLPLRDFKSGLAEVIKCAVISDAQLLSFMDRERSAILSVSEDHLLYLVSRALEIKVAHVQGDVREGGKRLKLNYGHTLGHAVEISTETLAGETYRHGEGVSIGVVAAALIAREYWKQDMSVYRAQKQILEKYDLPVAVHSSDIGFERTELLKECIRNVQKDKKRKDNHLRLILVPEIGKAEVCGDVPFELVEKAFDEIIRN